MSLPQDVISRTIITFSTSGTVLYCFFASRFDHDSLICIPQLTGIICREKSKYVRVIQLLEQIPHARYAFCDIEAK